MFVDRYKKIIIIHKQIRKWYFTYVNAEIMKRYPAS